MKRALAIVLALLLCGAALAEETGFVIRNGITWGMSEEEAMQTENNPRISEEEQQDEIRKKVRLSDVYVAGAMGDLELYFINDALITCEYLFSPNIFTVDYLAKALSSRYGEECEPDNGMILEAVTMLVGEEIPEDQLWPSGVDHHHWQLEDGTAIALVGDSFGIYVLYLDVEGLRAMKAEADAPDEPEGEAVSADGL